MKVTPDYNLAARAIYPNLRFHLEFIHKSVEQIFVINPTMLLRIKGSDGQLCYLGNFSFEQNAVMLVSQQSQGMTARINLAPYALKRIEEIRDHGDLNYTLNCYATVIDVNGGRNWVQGHLEGTIAKSTWVERYLPAFRDKEVILLEIPKLTFPEFNNVIGHLNDAWVHKSRGQYNIVLNCCRKTIEEIATIVREKGYEIKVENSNPLPDWKKFFEGEDLGDIVGTINKKLYGFTWPGAHTGKSVNREDADYALMITHATVNLVLTKLSIVNP